MSERSFKFKCVIYDLYKELLNKKVYEPIILNIMNSSTLIFPENYKLIREQSKGESDFISDSKGLFDAKILFYEKQCESLAMNKDNLTGFMNAVQRETGDISDGIQNSDINAVRNCIFYKEMMKELEKAKNGENIILFLPYAFTLEFSGSLASFMSSDVFSYIYSILIKDHPELYRNNQAYMIYINFFNEIVLKNLSTKQIEFICLDVFYKYIYFEIIDI